jgi:CheY-like chemotaxis protein
MASRSRKPPAPALPGHAGMDRLFPPDLSRALIQMGDLYGGLGFWPENLAPGTNPDATCRALLYLDCLGYRRVVPLVRPLIESPVSRVRARAALALAQLEDRTSLGAIRRLRDDPVGRVRVQARRALWAFSRDGRPRGNEAASIRKEDPVLLVSDDDPNSQRVLADILGGDGFRIVHASTEQETIECALRLSPDAILTDTQKGRDNLRGLQMTQDICRLAGLSDVPVFMVTADRVEPVFLWEGGDWFFPKSDLRTLRPVLVNFCKY